MNKKQSRELEQLATIFLNERGYDSKGKRIREPIVKEIEYYEEGAPPWEQEERHG